MDDRRPAQAGAQNPAYRPTHPLAPGDASHHDTLAGILSLEDAEAEARRAVELAPGDADYHDTLGRILRQRNLFDQAEREHRQAIALSDESASYHEGLGRLLAYQRLLRDAAVEFRRAIDSDPKSADAYIGLAITTSWTEGDDALAHSVELLEKAVDLDTRSYDARRNLGLVLLRRRDYSKAKEVLSNIGPPNNPEQRADLYFNLGVARLHQGDKAGAETAFREATTLSPLDSGAQVNLGISLYEEGRFDDAIEAFVKAIRIAPDSPDAHLALSQAYFTKGQFREGEQSFSRAAKLRDPDSDAYLQLYWARAEAGYWQMAEDALLTARECGETTYEHGLLQSLWPYTYNSQKLVMMYLTCSKHWKSRARHWILFRVSARSEPIQRLRAYISYWASSTSRWVILANPAIHSVNHETARQRRQLLGVAQSGILSD